MDKTYVININGRKEELPILQLPSGVSIAFFNLHGNTDLTEYCGKELAKIIGDSADVLMTAESKGLQLTHVAAKELGHSFYAVVRKTKKLYMQDGLSTEIKSITTGDVQNFYLSAHDSNLIKGKRVCLVDDVISTGGSLKGMEELVKLAGGTTVKKVAVLAEGDAANRDDIEFLDKLPLF